MRPTDYDSLIVKANDSAFVDFEQGYYISVTESDGDIQIRPEQIGLSFPAMDIIVGSVMPIRGNFHRMHFINATGADITLKYLLAIEEVKLPPTVGAVKINDSTPVGMDIKASIPLPIDDAVPIDVAITGGTLDVETQPFNAETVMYDTQTLFAGFGVAIPPVAGQRGVLIHVRSGTLEYGFGDGNVKKHRKGMLTTGGSIEVFYSGQMYIYTNGSTTIVDIQRLT